jgi:hypothetical protein
MLMKTSLLIAIIAASVIATGSAAQPIDARTQARIDRILKKTPLIDGHNDLAEQLRENYGMSIEGLAAEPIGVGRTR